MKNLEKMSLALLRKDYSKAALLEKDVARDPVTQFSTWFEEARLAQLPEPNAMSVSTADATGRPSSRILLLKEFDQRGFTWFTNYESRKGRDLSQNPYAALLFYWTELERQVRMEGRVERVSAEESDMYFRSRPLNSRIGAHASQQSMPIEKRELLDRRFIEMQIVHGEQPPRPAHWGGYRLVPERMEFWQGRTSRMHDRIVYTRAPEGTWMISRLQP
jgi:pyridoxamine 5'-phosphate oxidase